MVKRNILIHGLGISLRRISALVWMYLFGLGLAYLFSYPIKTSLANLLDSSFAAQRISSGFDLATVINSARQLREGYGRAAMGISNASIPAYLMLSLLLVPGTLFCYVTRSRARLSTLLQQGVGLFGRFVRITLLTVLATAVILGPLAALQSQWSKIVDDWYVGTTSLVLRLGGLTIVLLIASLLRLYFDLVEVYTVQLGVARRADGSSDRRIRKTLWPAFRLLRDRLWRIWPAFLLLAIAGAGGSFVLSRIAVHMLAQARVWPMFLTAQSGILLMLFARLWQRGTEVSLAEQFPLAYADDRSRIPFARPRPAVNFEEPQHFGMIYSDPLTPVYPAPLSVDDALVEHTIKSSPVEAVADPIPDPEPAVPPLDEPDPGVFHHDPRRRDI